MDIDEVRLEKINAEKAISEILKRLEDECKVKIMSIDVVSSDTGKNVFLDSRHFVTIRIEL